MEALLIAGTAVSAIGAIEQGNAARRAANFQASQMTQQAGQARATGQRAAIEKRQEADLVESRARALLAASGGGGDEGSVNILSGIRRRGDYNVATELYNADEQARGMELGAGARRFEGQVAKRASTIQAAGSVLSGASMYQKYKPR